MFTPYHSRTYPLFFLLMVTNLLAAAAAFFVGSWLVDLARFPATTWETMDAVKEYTGYTLDGKTDLDSDKEAGKYVRTFYTITIAIGVICVLFGFVMLWNALDILLLMCDCADSAPCLGRYKRCLKKEMSYIVGQGDVATTQKFVSIKA